MAMTPIPVTFHVRAEPRPELLAARRHRVRPYRVIVQGVAIFVVMGSAFGYVIAVMVSPQKNAAVAMKPAPVAAAPNVASAPPPFDVWRPPAPRPVATAFEPAKLSDKTPVATIPDTTPPRPARGFAPVERAPDYKGFKVTAGH